MSMVKEPSTSENHNSPQFLNKWIEIQESLRKQLITDDRFSWKLPPICRDQISEGAKENQDSNRGKILKYVGGADLSFSKTDPSIACATLIVLDVSTLEVVHEVSYIVELRVPYASGFLAFREAPVLLELLEKVKNTALTLYPQVLMVDGNGLLHPRGFGLACHLGVLADLRTIGIRKNAMRSTKGSLKPIFISVGHRISLASAIDIVTLSCRYRVPEPIRQADIRSRDCLRKHGLSLGQHFTQPQMLL